MDFAEYLTDETLEEEGVWMRLRKGDAEVLVARAGNKKHEDLVRRLRRKYGRGFRPGEDLPPEVEENISIEALAQTILLGWRKIEGPIPGVTDKAGPFAYSVEHARKLLKRSKDFRMEIVQIATTMEAYQQEAEEEGKKSSGK